MIGHGLTHQMKRTLEYIETSLAANGGVCPSFDEIAKGTGLKSKSGVHRIVNSLIARGHLTRVGNVRGLAVVTSPDSNYCSHCGQALPGKDK